MATICLSRITRLLLGGIAGLAALCGPAYSQLTVKGDVPAPVSLTADDLAKMPRQTVSVPEKDGSKTEYEGVLLRDILRRAGAPSGKELRGKALNSYIVAKASDNYQVVFTLAEVDLDFANETIIVADKREGKPLSANQGPLRLVVANDKAAARSVRMLETLELVRLAK
jgi:hypothetical protein